MSQDHLPDMWSKFECGGGGGRLSMIFILAAIPSDADKPLPAFARLLV